MRLLFILVITLFVKPIEKLFFHEGAVGDSLVFYLGSSMYVLSEHLDNGGMRVLFKNTDCAALDEIGHRTKNEHYAVYPVKGNGTCGLEIRPIVTGLHIAKPLVFKAINGKSSLSVEVKKKRGNKKASVCKKPVVIIDPGHGGVDSGTIGINGTFEKDLVLKIAKKLNTELVRRGIKVVLTRNDDVYIPLDKRTSLSNKHDCSIFISLHANYSSNPQVSGLEIFYSEMSLLGRSNLKKDLQSEKLATNIHKQLLNSLKSFSIVDRKVKKEVSQVLLGTDMPSVLIELGFLSNKIEAGNLCNSKYQERIVNGIVYGVEQYLLESTTN